MKKVMSLIMVLCLAFALAVPAFAADAATAGSAGEVAQISNAEQLKEMNRALVADKGFVNETITNKAKEILCTEENEKSVSTYGVDKAILKKAEAYFVSNEQQWLKVDSLQKNGNTLTLDITRYKDGLPMSVEEQLAEGPAVVRLYLDRDALDPVHNDYTWTNGEQSGVAVVGYITDYCYVEIAAPHFSSYTLTAQPKAEAKPEDKPAEPEAKPEEKPVEPEAKPEVKPEEKPAEPAAKPAENAAAAPAATGSVLAATGSDMTNAAAIIVVLAAAVVGASAVVLKKRGMNK